MEVINTWQGKNINLNTTTVYRILQSDNGGDSLALYTFYCATAVRQSQKSVKATDTFCMNGLKWGKTRFYNAKKALMDLGIVEQKIERKDGRIVGNYIFVRFAKPKYNTTENRTPENSPTENKRVENRREDFGKQIQEDKNINTQDKKEMRANRNSNQGEVNDSVLSELQKKYPKLNVRREWEKASSYAEARGKVYKNHAAYLRNWLIKSQEMYERDHPHAAKPLGYTDVVEPKFVDVDYAKLKQIRDQVASKGIGRMPDGLNRDETRPPA